MGFFFDHRLTADNADYADCTDLKDALPPFLPQITLIAQI